MINHLEFYYCFITFYIATIFAASIFAKIETEQDNYNGYFMFWVNYIPIANTIFLITFFILRQIELYRLKKSALKEIKNILENAEENY